MLQILSIATLKSDNGSGNLKELFGVVIGGFVFVAASVGVSLNPAVTFNFWLGSAMFQGNQVGGKF